MERHTLYLIDGSAYIYRSFHAIRNLSNSKGEPTNAVFGFTRTILKLLETHAPTHCGMLFDAKGPTFRHETYSEYKANRPPMPEDLVSQLPHIKAVTEAFGIPQIEMKGFEADDLAGTLARLAEEAGFDVVLVTGDKDYLQLVSDHVRIYDPVKEKWTDPETVREQFGFGPEGIIEMMALTGDSSDNVPGVPGIGPKTATTLIQEHATLEGVYEALDGMKKKKLKENLTNYKEDAFLSRNLVTIDRHAPVSFSPAEWERRKEDRNQLSDLFKALEFRQLQQQFPKETDRSAKDYRAIFSLGELDDAIAAIHKAGTVAFDTETTGLDVLSATLVGISLSWEEDQAIYIPLGHKAEAFSDQLPTEAVLEKIRPLLADTTICKVAQNLKYDWSVLLKYDVTFAGPLFDTLMASYLLDPTRTSHSLDALALDLLDHKTIPFKEVVTEKGAGFEAAPFAKGVEYACEDADITLALWRYLAPLLEENNLTDLFTRIEMPLVPVLMRMETTGVMADAGKLEALSAGMAEELATLTAEIHDMAGEPFNINSSQQLGKVLFETLGLPVQKKTKKKTGYSTDVSVLTTLAAHHPLPEKVLRHRSVGKLKSTYADALQQLIRNDTRRIHTSFNQGVTATGRLSSSEPNLQNIPIRTPEGREIRKAFIPRPGWQMMAADYSQIELRLLAHCSEDPILIEAFQNDEDIHSRTASEVFQVIPEFMTEDLRRQAKAINFGIVYGMSAFRLSNELGISQKMAKTYIDHYFARYAGVRAFIDTTISGAQETGAVSTLFGRTRPVPDIASSNRNLRQMAERIAVNTPIQGTAADLIKMAMVNVDAALRERKMETTMLLTVHDELVFEVPPSETETAGTLIRELMENIHPLLVPLKVNLAFGANWSEAH